MSQDAPYRIVVAVDLTEMTDIVLAKAAQHAAMCDRAVIHVVCAVDSTQDVLGRQIDHSKELTGLETAVRARSETSLADSEATIEVHTRPGRPPDVISDLAQEVRADLIVVGRHSQTRMSPLFLGSVPSRLLAQAKCDVLVVQPNTYDN